MTDDKTFLGPRWKQETPAMAWLAGWPAEFSGLLGTKDQAVGTGLIFL